MTIEAQMAEVLRRLAESEEARASLMRMLERQGYQLDRMQDQLEQALKEAAALRRQLNRPPPDEPTPTPPAGGAPEGPTGTATPEPPIPSPPPRDKRAPGKKKTFGRNQIPAELERVPDPQAPGACSVCGGDPKAIRDETVEVYDFQPARVVVRQVIRPVCRCTNCQHIEAAPFPADLVPRLRASPALIANIIHDKFGRHLTLHRVDQELGRLGAAIPESTRDGWLIWAAAQLSALIDPHRRSLFSLALLHTDGTGLDVIEPHVGTRLGQMAVFVNALGAWYVFTATKHGRHQRQALGLEAVPGEPPVVDAPRFRGHLCADAASVADRTYADGSIIELGCNAHARCKFEDVEPIHRRAAGEALAFWTALYAVEADATKRKVDPSCRLVLRQEKSAPIVADLRRWLDAHLFAYTPTDPLTKALNYLNNHWDALTRFLTDGRFPIDNNLAERMLRAVAIGRNNYLFAGSDAAAERSAVFYTFVMTCRVNGVDPVAWLTDVLPRIGGTKKSELAELLPAKWKCARAKATDKAA
jgi:transposase